MIQYVYRYFKDAGCYTVGFYDPSEKWEPESDYKTADEAAERVAHLNCGASIMHASKERGPTMDPNVIDQALDIICGGKPVESTLRTEPVRPDLPIRGMTQQLWISQYGKELSQWFRTCHGHYADGDQWLLYCGLMWDVQQTSEETV